MGGFGGVKHDSATRIGKRFAYETARLVFVWCFQMAHDTVDKVSNRLDLSRSNDSTEMDPQRNPRDRDEACTM